VDSRASAGTCGGLLRDERGMVRCLYSEQSGSLRDADRCLRHTAAIRAGLWDKDARPGERLVKTNAFRAALATQNVTGADEWRAFGTCCALTPTATLRAARTGTGWLGQCLGESPDTARNDNAEESATGRIRTRAVLPARGVRGQSWPDHQDGLSGSPRGRGRPVGH
jgi:hypothetical protein